MEINVGDPVRFVGAAPNIAGKEGIVKALGSHGTIAEFKIDGDDTGPTYVVSTLLLEKLPPVVIELSRAPE